MLKKTGLCGKVLTTGFLTLSLVACSNIPNNEVADFDGSVAHDIQLLLDPLSGTVSPIVVNEQGFASVTANVCTPSVSDVPIAFKNACKMSGGHTEGDFCINNDNGLYTSTYAYYVDKVCQTDKFLIKVVINQSHSTPLQFDEWARFAHQVSKGQ